MTIEDNNFINWDEQLAFGIPVIDDQHKNLIRIINKLHLICLRSSDTTTRSFIEGTKEAIYNLRFHFTIEEKLMVLLAFHEHDEHRREHGAFLKEAISLQRQIKDEQLYAPHEFVFFLKERLLNHIKTFDTVFADYILALEHHEKLKMILVREPQLSPVSVQPI